MNNLIQTLAQKLLVIYPDQNQAQQVVIWLLEKLLNQTSSQLLLLKKIDLDQAQTKLLNQWLEQLVVEHKPVQYILGSVPFLDLEILVEPPVLIPRLETEWWVDGLINGLAQFKHAQLKILDLCSGSGCIGLALASYFKQAHVVAVDLTQAACILIEKNKIHNQITNLEIKQGDLYTGLGDQKFDLIISNPPYVPASAYAKLDQSVLKWEDRTALVSPGDDLAIIRKIIVQASTYLQNNYVGLPKLIIEIDETQGELVVNLMQAAFEQVEILKDQFNRPRVVIGK